MVESSRHAGTQGILLGRPEQRTVLAMRDDHDRRQGRGGMCIMHSCRVGKVVFSALYPPSKVATDLFSRRGLRDVLVSWSSRIDGSICTA